MVAALTTLPATIALVLATVGSVVAALLLARRLPAPRQHDDDLVRRVLRNSALPIASQLVIRVIDLAIAIVLLRLLGPEGNGRYAVAVIIWLYVKTVSDFGLGLLATREIARDRGLAGLVIGETTLFRLLVLTLTAAPVALYLGAGLASDGLATSSAVAVVLLWLSVVPASYAEAVSSALNGIERMDASAALNVAVGVARAPLVVLLGARMGVEGVALAALLGACMSAALYHVATRRVLMTRVRWGLSRDRARWIAHESWPLLVNALLVSLFFRLDVFVVQAFRGDRELGIYDAAYKLINLVTIVPAYVTLAVFPTLSRRASDAGELLRVHRMAAYLLVWLAWGIVAVTCATANSALRVLAGDDYLPEAALLLRMLIFFAPLSFLNGVAQYTLVAAGRQRQIVPAFAVAVAFNLLVNLALVDRFGARAAAGTTVATEVVILLALAAASRRSEVRPLSRAVLAPLWRPTIAGALTAAVALAVTTRANEAAALVAALVTFAGASALTRVLGVDERALLRRAFARGARRAAAAP